MQFKLHSGLCASDKTRGAVDHDDLGRIDLKSYSAGCGRKTAHIFRDPALVVLVSA